MQLPHILIQQMLKHYNIFFHFFCGFWPRVFKEMFKKRKSRRSLGGQEEEKTNEDVRNSS